METPRSEGNATAKETHHGRGAEGRRSKETEREQGKRKERTVAGKGKQQKREPLQKKSARRGKIPSPDAFLKGPKETTYERKSL